MGLQLTRLFNEPFAGGGTTASGGTVVPWWRTEYPFRHQYSLASFVAGDTIPVGHPAVITFQKSLTIDKGKVRHDFADIAVLYLAHGGALPFWQVIPLTVVDNIVTFDVIFPVQREISDPDENYFVYYGNPQLQNAPPVNVFDVPDWPITIPNDGFGVSYTHPGVDWKDGSSSTVNAQASLIFAGTKVRLLSHTDIDQGIAQVQVDDGSPTSVDLFAANNTPAVNYNTGHLTDSFTYWTNAPGTYQSSEVYVTPLVDGTPEGFFFAHEVYFNLAESPLIHTMYIGLQTTDADQNNGKSVHFSGFGATAGTSPSNAQLFTNEGTGYKTSIPFTWVVGHEYRLQMIKDSDNGTDAWWAGYVIDTVTGVKSLVGKVRYPSNVAGSLDYATALFHERFSNATHQARTSSSYNDSSVLFAEPTMNNNIQPDADQIHQIQTSTNIPVFIDQLSRWEFESTTGIDPSLPLGQTEVWEATSLEPGLHRVYVRVTGRKNPNSLGTNVNVQAWQYEKAINITDHGEESDSLSWASYFAGGKS